MASIEDGGFGAKKPDNMSLSGHEWYTQQAHRAVNQAIGRVIRNRNDYGSVLLLDSRFSLQGNQQGLSKWVRPHILKDEGVGKAISCLVKFYKQAAVNVEKRRHLLPPPARPPNKVAVILQYEEEGKENRGSNSDEDELTKIAIIKQGTESNKLALGSQSVGNDETSNEYVPADRIIARLDMKQSGSKDISRLINETRRTSAQERGTSDGPSLGETATDAATPAVRAPEHQSPAVEFFRQIQTLLSKEEFVSIKKAAVAMRQCKDIEYRRSFLKAARVIINVILDHEKFENRSTSNKPTLLFLLFKLLPKHYLLDCQRWAAFSIFQQSSLRGSLESSLGPIVFKKSRNDFVEILRKVWLEEDESKRLSPSAAVKTLQKLALPLVEANNNFEPSELRKCLSILPTNYHAPVGILINALEDDLRASRNIKQVKEMEKRECGENAVQSNMFRNPPPALSAKRCADSEATSTNGLSNSITSQAIDTPSTETNTSSLAASEVVKKRINPYKRKASSEQKKMKKSMDLATANPLQRAIDQSASQIFTGKPVTYHRVESNAPKNMTCRLCDGPSEKVSDNAMFRSIRLVYWLMFPFLFQPVISPCGHMACISCWEQWLKKSETCPVCRQPCQRDSLAMVVYKQ
eukprot:scaffold4811_cov171-Cylindrotheca_fusiformis.AAC.2